MPVIITVSAATNAVAPAAPAVASIVKPAERANIPTPIPAIANANTPIAAERASNAGVSGLNRAPAIPITANAPANVISPLPILSQLIDPKDFKTGVNKANPVAATTNAADPLRDPLMAFNPIDSSTKTIPSTVSPFPILSQLINPKDFKTGVSIASADAINNICPPNLAIDPLPLLIILEANTNVVTMPNIPAPPFANSFQLIEPKLLPTVAKIPTAADMISICPANLVIDLLSVFMSLAAPTNIVTIPNIPAPPFTNSSQLIEPSILATPDNAATAVDNINICPANLVIDLLSVFISLVAVTSIVTIPPIPASPFATPFQSRSARIFIAPASIRIDAPRPII